MRVTVVALLLSVTAAGCAAGSATRQASSGEGMAAPGPELVGTWRGTAFAVPGANYGTSTPVELTITPDGTWTWAKRGERQATGRVRLQGDQVVLEEAGPSPRPVEAIRLEQRGDHLWGVSRAFIPGWMSAVDLMREAPQS